MNSNACCPTVKPETTAQPAPITEVRPAFSTHDNETGSEFRIALPGVRKEDLKLTVHEGLLSLEANRLDGKSPLRYRLTANLASRLDGGAVAANLDHGVLEIKIPLRAEAQPRSIAIH